MAPAANGPASRGITASTAARQVSGAVALLVFLALCARDVSDPLPSPLPAPPAPPAPVEPPPLPPVASWARLKISVLLDGEAPPRRRIVVDDSSLADMGLERGPLSDFALVHDGRIEDVAVFAEPLDLRGPPPSPEEEVVVLEAERGLYRQRILTATVGQTLIVCAREGNSHGHHLESQGNGGGNRYLRKGEEWLHPLTTPELGIRIGCSAHTWLTASLCVFSHSFHAVTRADGAATLRLPPGTYRVGAWHRYHPWTAPAPVTVTVGPGESRDVELRFRAKER